MSFVNMFGLFFHQSKAAPNLTSGDSYIHNDTIKQTSIRNHQEIIFTCNKIYSFELVFWLNNNQKIGHIVFILFKEFAGYS